MTDGILVTDFLGLTTDADELDLAPGVSPSLKNVSFARKGALRPRAGLVKVENTAQASGGLTCMHTFKAGPHSWLVFGTTNGDIQADNETDGRQDEDD